MKKLISIILAAVMAISSMSAVAFAEEEEWGAFRPGDEYKDVDLDGPEPEAVMLSTQAGTVSYDDMTDYTVVGILGALNVLGAYEGSSFKPNVYISRAEFIEGIVKLLNVEILTDLDEYRERFYDVPLTHEKAAYIYTALNMGIISGYDNNTYKPDSVISYMEAITILVRILGYEEFAQKRGGYPMGYVQQAGEIGLTKNLIVQTKEALTRMDMANMFYNTLFTNIAEINYSGLYKTYGDSEQLFLNHRFKTEKSTGIVTATNVSALIGKNKAGAKFIAIDDVAYYAGTDAYNSLLGYKVDYYYKDEMLVYACAHKNVEEVVVPAKNKGKYDFNTKTYTYFDEESNRNEVLKLTSDYALFYNGVMPETIYDEKIFDIIDGEIRFVSNDKGSTYSVAKIENCQNYIIKSVALDGTNLELSFDYISIPVMRIDCDKVTVDAYNQSGASLDMYKVDDKGMQSIDISGFKVGMVLSIYTPWGYGDKYGLPIEGNYTYLKMITSDAAVSGTPVNYNSTKKTFVIGDTEYRFANSNYFEAAGSEFNMKQNDFLLDSYGNAVALRTSTTDWLYGYLIKPDFENYAPMINGLRLMNQKGKVIRLAVKDKLIINGKKFDNLDSTMAELTKSAQMTDASFKYGQVIKYRTDETGELVKEIQTITQSTGVASGYNKNHLKRDVAMQKFRVEDDAWAKMLADIKTDRGLYFKPKYVFKVPKTEMNDDSYYSSYTLPNDKEVEMNLYDVDNLQPAVGVVFIDGQTETSIGGGYAGWDTPVMLDHVYMDLDEDELPVMKIVAVNYGGTTEYMTSRPAIMEQLKGYEKGQMLHMYHIDGDVSNVIPTKIDGKLLCPSTLKELSVETNHTFTTPFDDMYECYSISSSGDTAFVVQKGAYAGDKDDIYKRVTQHTNMFAHVELEKGGVMVYNGDGVDQQRSSVGVGTISSLKPAKIYGDKASIIIQRSVGATALQHLIYNITD